MNYSAISIRNGGGKALVALMVAMLLMLGCETAGPKTAIGAATGAAAGGLIGAAAGGGTTGIIGGVLLGGLLGGAIGNALDQRDQELLARNNQYALESAPSGTATTWQNPDSGHSGTITPTRTYQSGSGQHCREFQQTVTVGGETQDAYGTACRQPDGSWQIVQ